MLHTTENSGDADLRELGIAAILAGLLEPIKQYGETTVKETMIELEVGPIRSRSEGRR